ncbi:carbohydrate kinase family protein [Clostridiales bacterium COT073_COT-073]|nr:carbohydrate kinase family protein [Clostridiales bacterium COT073_COT-073]
MKIDVLTSGYVSMDHIIKIDKPAQVGFTSLVTNKSNTNIYYGGCSVNIAYALCRLGIPAMPILRVGSDYEENGFKRFLEEGQVSLQGTEVLPNEVTSTCYLIQDNNNDHITIFYPGAMDGQYARPLPDSLFENLKLAVMTVASRPDNEEFFGKCIKHNVPIAFGMKDDFDAFPQDFLKQLLTSSKIIFMNQAEKEIIEKIYGYTDVTELFAAGKAEIIVTTLGKDGSICYLKHKNGVIKKEIPIYPLEEIVDATGSGDAYISGFIYGYLNGYEPDDCCKFGSAMAYFVLQKEGCCTNLPTVQELKDKVFR